MKPVSLMAISIALFSLSVTGELVIAQQSDRQKTSVTINTDLVVTWAQVMDRNDGYSPGYGLLSKLGISKEGKMRRSGGAIEEFVANTGGSILTGKPEEGDELLIRLAGLIRSSYTIGYYPENPDFDGRFRRISLELSPQGKAKVGRVNIETRNGYWALRPSAAATLEMSPAR